MVSGEGPAADQAAQSLIRYLPHYRRAAFDIRRPWRLPGHESALAAVLRADIVGFTALTDRMVQGGIAGAESLAKVLSAVINRMAEIAAANGGDLALWEGDAGVYIWREREDLPLESAVRLAAQTALAIQAEAETWRIDGAPIRFRSGVGCGSLLHFEIGGVNDEWRSALAGEALREVLSAVKAAEPGMVVLGRAAQRLAGARFRTLWTNEDAAAIVAALDPASPPRTGPPTGEVAIADLRKAVPPLVAGGRGDALASGEFRVVTVAYFRLRHPEYLSAEDTLATLQKAAERVQRCLAQFEGQIYQVAPEDGDVTFIALFGLPPWSYEDAAARAIKSALWLHREWGALGLTGSTGVSTGRIFVGTIETTTDRAVLALVGPPMNLAARLMQLNAGVVCDEDTRQAGRQAGRIVARQLAPQWVKGKSEPVTAYAAYDVTTASPSNFGEEAAPVGRERELATLGEALARLRSGVGGTWVVEGEAGIGKTTLIQSFAAAARDGGVTLLAGGGDSTDQTTPHLAWRGIVIALLQQSDLTSPALRIVTPRSAGVGFSLSKFAALVPLIEDMLGLESIDTQETALLRGQARADALSRLLSDLFAAAAASGPIVTVLEDMHWLDPTSLRLFADLASAPPPMLLVASTRGPDTNPIVRKTLAPTPTQWLTLAPLNVSETGALLARALGAAGADDELAAMFCERTGGNPLFVEELSRMAFANRLLFIDGPVRARSTAPAARDELDRILERHGLPDTIEGVIRRRIDSLSPQEMSVLRVASVVGSGFTPELCAAGLPQLARADIELSLAALAGLGLIEVSGRMTDAFQFRHEVVRDVVYNAMSFAERRLLHEAVGNWIERQPHPEDVSALLARHFTQAQKTDKAVIYLTRAGDLALRRYANAEAANLLLKARDLARAEASRAPSDAARRETLAHISLRLGRAYQGLSRYGECRACCEEGLQLVGSSAPRGAAGLFGALLAETAKLFARGRATALPVETLRESVLAHEALAETYFYSGDGMRTLLAAMSALNLSERLGPSAELARGCATLSGIAGFFRLRRASAHYGARALAVLERLDDPAAETWVYMLLGLSQLSQGAWAKAAAYLSRVEAAALRTGDRRRWRDAVENTAIIAACRGAWPEALAGLTRVVESAREDRDQRYLVMAARERAYCALHAGLWLEAEADYELIRREFERGLTAEEVATRLDMHALAATLALERGETFRALEEADQASQALTEVLRKSSVANVYWPMSLLARVLTQLALAASPSDARRDLERKLAIVSRATASQVWSYPIAAPAAGIARAALAVVRGRRGAAIRAFRRAAAEAQRLEMAYELQLAHAALGEAAAPPGLALFAAKGSSHAE